jgi:hypothetical protein
MKHWGVVVVAFGLLALASPGTAVAPAVVTWAVVLVGSWFFLGILWRLGSRR